MEGACDKFLPPGYRLTLNISFWQLDVVSVCLTGGFKLFTYEWLSMAELPEEPPEGQRFEEFTEIAIDGTPMLRIEQVPEVQTSPVDDAATALFLRGIVEATEERLKEEYDMDIEDILNEQEPEIMAYAPEDDSWEDLTG